jgi:hypothetical protein
VPDTWITDEMRAAIGRPVGKKRVSFPITASDIRRWAQAVYYPDPPPAYFWDRAEAVARFGGFVAPEEFNPFAWMTADGPPDHDPADRSIPIGPEVELGVTPPATVDRLNGGLEVEYTGVRMREGDVVTAVGRLADYREREGRLGLMLFTVTESEWTNDRGELIKTERNTLIRY